MLDKRDATSKEGIALLKRGATVIKFSRVGKASVATLRLSADEQLLTWRGKDSGFKLINKDKRELEVSAIGRVAIGRDMPIFMRAKEAAAAKGHAHLSLSLVMRPSAAAEGTRETLDLACADEEHFGLIVACFRALISERQERAAALQRPWASGSVIITAPPTAYSAPPEDTGGGDAPTVSSLATASTPLPTRASKGAEQADAVQGEAADDTNEATPEQMKQHASWSNELEKRVALMKGAGLDGDDDDDDDGDDGDDDVVERVPSSRYLTADDGEQGDSTSAPEAPVDGGDGEAEAAAAAEDEADVLFRKVSIENSLWADEGSQGDCDAGVAAAAAADLFGELDDDGDEESYMRPTNPFEAALDSPAISSDANAALAAADLFASLDDQCEDEAADGSAQDDDDEAALVLSDDDDEDKVAGHTTSNPFGNPFDSPRSPSVPAAHDLNPFGPRPGETPEQKIVRLMNEIDDI